MKNLTPVKIVTYAVIALFALIVFLYSYSIIPSGKVGVLSTMGKISDSPLTDGFNLIAPFVQSVTKVDCKTQKVEEEVSTYTKDIQPSNLRYALNYSIKKDYATKLWKEVGAEHVEKILNPAIYGTIKDVVGKWEAKDLVSNREKAAEEILMSLKNVSKYYEITAFNFVDIDYSDEFEKVIEQKVAAEQEALKQINRTRSIEEQAKQQVIAAEAEAKAMKIKAEALAYNQRLVEYEAVLKWN
ncbi:MAG: prohibitin family protein [Bacteroidales bacterium]|jgi:regulator of protease activity HflC (stomatin/prohibitin superfamily)|nr:prohibitin family protein [Bacteroidales bacterium]